MLREVLEPISEQTRTISTRFARGIGRAKNTTLPVYPDIELLFFLLFVLKLLRRPGSGWYLFE